MDKRTFLKTTGVLGAAALVNPFWACSTANKEEEKKEEEKSTGESAENKEKTDTKLFTLPELPYKVGDLEPNIDKMTMEIHHGKHHAGYVKKLNNAIAENEKFAGMDLQKLLANVGTADSDLGVRNNGGGHYNHSLFWKILSPKSSKPSGKVLEAINASFDSIDNFKKLFNKEAKSVFGSGWAWLCVDESKKLFVTSTPNQDNPMMKNIVKNTGTPILGIDVWEHAYYLKYQNKRGDYISAFWNIINWEQVNKNLSEII